MPGVESAERKDHDECDAGIEKDKSFTTKGTKVHEGNPKTSWFDRWPRACRILT